MHLSFFLSFFFLLVISTFSADLTPTCAVNHPWEDREEIFFFWRGYSQVRPQLFQFTEPVWTDSGVKCGNSGCNLISTKKKKKRRGRGMNGRSFSKNPRKREREREKKKPQLQ